ncbi:hypothetical protein GCM10023320_03030 [Pseudonocardia adelaidensis]|uniref:Glycosyltransferase n=2 Tax=Pseudonocardia adelaidensis TaxID=648754 RepID=A0ABP9N8U7_9PSEU
MPDETRAEVHDIPAGLVPDHMAGTDGAGPAPGTRRTARARAVSAYHALYRTAGGAARTGGWPTLATLARSLALPSAVVLWLVSLLRIDPHGMGDLGLVPLLPDTFWLALALVLVSFCIQVYRRPPSVPMLVCHVVTLIALLHATPSLLYPTLRYSWAWKHVGVVDFFMRNAGVNRALRELGAYQSWPGFFSTNAMLTKASGLTTSAGYAVWAPPFFNVLLIGPLFLIFRTFTTDQRLIWSAIALFFLGSWVGQDYLSPQACTFFLFLCVLALCLRYLGPRSVGAPNVPSPLTGGGWRSTRLWITVATVVMMAAIVPTHQLTPLMLIGGLVTLVVFGRQRLVVPTLFMIGMTVAWDLSFAWPWLSQNLGGIESTFGAFGANANSGFINLAAASQGQVLVAQVDRAHSAAVWVLALLGFARHFRSRRELALPLLALTPIAMIFANDYDGEMIFRIYMFGLPFAIFYVGAAFFPRQTAGRSWWTRLTLPAVALLLVPGFAFSYYGKEEANYFSDAELQAAQFVYGVAPRGSLVASATSDFPWGFTNYEVYDYERFALEDRNYRQEVLTDPVGTFTDMMSLDKHHHSYLILTRAQRFDVEMTGMMPQNSLSRIEQSLERSPNFVVLYRNADAVVLTLVRPIPERTP